MLHIFDNFISSSNMRVTKPLACIYAYDYMSRAMSSAQYYPFYGGQIQPLLKGKSHPMGPCFLRRSHCSSAAFPGTFLAKSWALDSLFMIQWLIPWNFRTYCIVYFINCFFSEMTKHCCEYQHLFFRYSGGILKNTHVPRFLSERSHWFTVFFWLCCFAILFRQNQFSTPTGHMKIFHQHGFPFKIKQFP